MRSSSFCITRKIIKARMLLKPPLVLPAQAPMNITAARMSQVRWGQAPTSSQKMPVVVMKDTTWKSELRKACSMS